MSQLLTPVRVGRYVAPNRLVMAPMTRSRADDTSHWQSPIMTSPEMTCLGMSSR